MKVKDMPYEHIPLEELQAEMRAIIDGVKAAKSVDEILALRERYLKLWVRLATARTLVEIRYTCNTADEFYVKENDYFDEIGPVLSNLDTEYGNALLASPFRPQLEKALSPVYFSRWRKRPCPPPSWTIWWRKTS